MVLFILSLCRQLTQNYNERKFRYKLFAIRDRLRRLEIEGKIDHKNRIFDFYDLSLSKMINESYYITAFYVIMLSIKQKDNVKLNQIKALIDLETDKIPELKVIRQAQTKAVAKYIRNQHFVTFILLKFLLAPFKGAYYISKKVKSLSESASFFPQTSAISNYSAGV